MNILIDGPDGVGKSAVCELLRLRLGIPLIKMPNMPEYIKKGNVEEMSWLYNQVVMQFRKFNFIQDRGFTSSLVYNRVYNRNANLDYIKDVENILKPWVFILTGRDEVLFERRPEDEVIDRKHRVLVNHEFKMLADVKGYHIIDTSDLTPEEVCQIIVQRTHAK